MKKKSLIFSVIFLSLLVLGSWVFALARYSRENPPLRHQGFIVSEEVDAFLRASCFDCHSNETRYPWYSSLPVASLMMGRHIEKGRERMNYSEWDQLPLKDKRKALRKSLEAIRKQEMPPFDYALMHSEAGVSKEQADLMEKVATKRYHTLGDGKDDHNDHKH